MRALSIGLLLATAVAMAAGQPAWGHTFAPLRSIVLQVEACEVVMMVGYRAGSREDADSLVARVANQPKSHAAAALRDVLAAHAMAPLALSVDGAALVPTTVRAKLAQEAPGGRPMVVVLVTYSLSSGKQLSLATRDPRSTRISWTDRRSGRVDLDGSPAQGKFFSGVASFLLNLTPVTQNFGGSARCALNSKH
jgi:hypothetical protein